MALICETVEYAFETQVGNVYTSSVPSSSNADPGGTGNTFPQITCELTPNVSRTIKSVILEGGFRFATGTAESTSGFAFTITLGAGTPQTYTATPTAQTNTGDPEMIAWFHFDVTAQFVSDFGAGDTQTVTLDLKNGTTLGVTAYTTNHVAKLIITFEADITSATTRAVKTVRIPIQSHHTTLTNAQAEFGTSGGTNNAPANQIPILTGAGGILKEASVSVVQAHLLWIGQDGGNATTDFSLETQVDSATVAVRAVVEQALNGGSVFYDTQLYNTGTYATTSAHALKARSNNLTARFLVGAFLVVTYAYDPSTTTTTTVSLLLPFGQRQMQMLGTAIGDCEREQFDVWVEDSSPALLQSGVAMFGLNAAAASVVVRAGAQAVRTYALANPSVMSGGSPIVHRIDHGSPGITLARGSNKINIDFYATAAGAFTLNGGFLVLNYSATYSAGRNTRTTAWSVAGVNPSAFSAAHVANLENANTVARAPALPSAGWMLVWMGHEMTERLGAAFYAGWSAELLSGEGAADGWARLLSGFAQTDAEMGPTRMCAQNTALWNATPFDSGKMSLSAARKYRKQDSAAAWLLSVRSWCTFHAFTYSVSKVAIGYSGDGSGIAVRVFDSVTGKQVGAATTAIGGGFTTTVYSNVNQLFTEARQSAGLRNRSEPFSV